VSAPLAGVAVVTGASSGIGRAVARALAPEMSLCLTGRDAGRLEEAAHEIGAGAGRVLVHRTDLGSEEAIRGLVESVATTLGRLDVLVHAAGAIRLGDLEHASADDLDELYRINLRAPFLLTKASLPLLKETRGQIVFVGSTAARVPAADNPLYAATKLAVGSLAGSVREHVNRHGIRVLTVLPGRTATPMQEAVHRREGRRYEPATLLQPADVAEVIAAALRLPRTAEVTEVALRPMKKPSEVRP